jgi:cell division septation protein DedD
VDVVATVRTTARHPKLDGVEEQVASAGPEVWSIRLTGAAAPEPVAPVPPRAMPTMPDIPPLPPRAAERPARTPSPAPATVSTAVLDEERPASSLAPRIAVIVFGLLVIAFVAWWFMQNRGNLHLAGGKEPAATAVDSTRQAAAPPVAHRDTTVTTPPVTRPAHQDSTAVVKPHPSTTPPATAPAGTTSTTGTPKAGTAHSGGTMLVNSSDIQVMDDLNRRFRGWYMIHISSFQTSVRARDEVAFLESHEFPVFIVFLDLGPKGKWYRVYAGPFQTRDEAVEVKKNLDAVPQVRFTRIATIPD